MFSTAADKEIGENLLHNISLSLVYLNPSVYRLIAIRKIAIAVTTRIDCFGFCLTASAGVRTVAVAGTGGSLLILKNPCVAAAVRTSAGTVTTSAVTLIGVSAKVLDVVAE